MRSKGIRYLGGNAQVWLLFTVLTLLVVANLHLVTPAQTRTPDNANSAAQSPTPTPSPSPTPIPLSAIIEQSDAAASELQQIKVFLNNSPRNETLENDISALAGKVDLRSPETKELIEGGVSLDELNSVQLEWDGMTKSISVWKADLLSQTAELDKRIADLRALRDVWQQTYNAVTASPTTEVIVGTRPGEVVPEQLIQRINETIASIDETQKLVESRRSDLLTFQTRVSNIESNVSSVTTDIKASRSAALSRLFVRDHPALWKIDWSVLSLSRVSTEISVSVSSRIRDLRDYAGSQSERFLLHGVIVLLLSAALFWARQRAEQLAKKNPEVERSAGIFKHPFATALLLSIFLTGALYPQAPKLLSTLLGAAALVPAVILLRRLVDRSLFPIIDILVGFYFFDRVRDLVSALPNVSRLVFVLQMLVAVGLLLWLLRSKRLASRVEAGNYNTFLAIRRILPFAIAIYTLALIANLLGYVSLAYIVGNGVLRSSYAALILYTAAEVLGSLFNFAVRVRPLSDLRMMNDHRTLIHARLVTMVRWIAFLAWLYLALLLFSIKDIVIGWVTGILTFQIEIGALSLSLSHVVVFVIAVWLAFVLSRFIRFVLDEDVYPRMDLGGGLSYAVSTMVHYVVLIVGFMIAIAALGIELSKFTILAGAFGVGMGFGLQTIINNFVSGLILLFERPVKVGDSVQIGEHQGELRQIGLRASVLRKADGSDVILPNSMLISEDVINWTMADKIRRIDIPVGIAYGSDAKLVIDLLTGVVANERTLVDDPAPVTLFKGFGENSIDFELRAWTEDTENWVQLRSKLVTAIYEALNKANIEIPVPQRDLHVRSVEGDADIRLKGGNAG